MKFTNVLYIEDDPDTRFLQARLAWWRSRQSHRLSNGMSYGQILSGFVRTSLGDETALD